MNLAYVWLVLQNNMEYKIEVNIKEIRSILCCHSVLLLFLSHDLTCVLFLVSGIIWLSSLVRVCLAKLGKIII